MSRTCLFLLLTAVAATIGAGVLLAETRRAHTDARVARANELAALDALVETRDRLTATVTLAQTQARLSQDSVAALARSLGAAIAARDQAIAQITTLEVTVQGLRQDLESTRQGADVSGARHADFHLEGPPVTGDIHVEAPADLVAPWTLAARLFPSPYSLTYTVGCSPSGVANVNVTSPEWVSVRIGRGVVSPDVCNPVAPGVGAPSFSWGSLLPDLSWRGLGLGALKAGVIIGLWETLDYLLEGDEAGDRR